MSCSRKITNLGTQGERTGRDLTPRRVLPRPERAACLHPRRTPLFFLHFLRLNARASQTESTGPNFLFPHVAMISSAGEVSLTFRPNPADPFPLQTRRRRRISKISEARHEQNVSTHARARDGVVVPPRREPRARCPRRRRRPRRPEGGPAAPTAVAVVRQVFPSVPGRRDRGDRGSTPPTPGRPTPVSYTHLTLPTICSV